MACSEIVRLCAFHHRFSIVMFPIIMFSIDVFCSLMFAKFNTLGAEAADFIFPLFPTGHGLLALIIVHKGGAAGTLCSATVYLSTFYSLYMRWSAKGLDDNLTVHLKSKVGNHCDSQSVLPASFM